MAFTPYFFGICSECGEQIPLAEARDEPFPLGRSIKTACTRCGSGHIYEPVEMQLGEFDDGRVEAMPFATN